MEPSKIKEVLELVREQPVLTPELLSLAWRMFSYYAAPMEAILETMIPVGKCRGAKSKMRKYLRAAGPIEQSVLDELKKRAPKQAKLLSFRDQITPSPKIALLKRLGVQSTSCSALVEKGLVEETSSRQDRIAYDDELNEVGTAVESVDVVKLTDEQSVAVDSMLASRDEGGFKVHLLHGVTGSGKTEVYLRLMEAVLEGDGGVLFLVPEVSLAPQTVDRIRARFDRLGVDTAVWHSHLSDGERLDAWQMVADGRARVVVGARSAVYAPVKNLQLVIVDEEHEPAFKQEETRVIMVGMLRSIGPCYQSVSVYSVPLLLCGVGEQCNQGKYRLDRLTRRVDEIGTALGSRCGYAA